MFQNTSKYDTARCKKVACDWQTLKPSGVLNVHAPQAETRRILTRTLKAGVLTFTDGRDI